MKNFFFAMLFLVSNLNLSRAAIKRDSNFLENNCNIIQQEQLTQVRRIINTIKERYTNNTHLYAINAVNNFITQNIYPNKSFFLIDSESLIEVSCYNCAGINRLKNIFMINHLPFNLHNYISIFEICDNFFKVNNTQTLESYCCMYFRKQIVNFEKIHELVSVTQFNNICSSNLIKDNPSLVLYIINYIYHNKENLDLFLNMLNRIIKTELNHGRISCEVCGFLNNTNFINLLTPENIQLFKQNIEQPIK